MNVRGRIRQLKPELFLDDEFWELLRAHPELPLLQGFLGLWCQADREGRFEWRPAPLKTQIVPYWQGDFGAVLGALRDAGLVQMYEVDGRRYGAIRNFHKHQRPNNREPLSCIPEPLEHPKASLASAEAGSAGLLEPRASAPRASRPPLPTPDTQLPTPTPTRAREPAPESSPAVTTIRPARPGPLQPSRREQQREAEAARLGTTPAFKHRFNPDWLPSPEHQTRGHELGLTDQQILDEAEDCRRKTYERPFADEDDQFFRELTWLAADLTRQRFKENRHERERFENPGRDRRDRSAS